MSAASLQASRVCAGYGRDDVLRNVSVALAGGEVLGVVGPNGSGKSTLVRAVTGLLPLRSGEVRLGGRDLGELGARERAQLCAVQPQAEAPVFDYAVEEFVMLGRHPHRPAFGSASEEDRAAVLRAMDQADISHLAARGLRALSLGEWQRALLARALAQQTPLLLLDEPAAHLDPGHRYGVHVLLQRLARENGRAVLCVSHDLNLAAEFCDCIALMHRGEIAAIGTPEEVLREDLLQEVFSCAALRVAPNPFTGRPGTVFAP